MKGLVLFVGVAQFLLAMLVAECIYPNYSVSQNYISDLGVGPVALIFNTSIILFGLSVLYTVYQLRNKEYYPLALSGIGAIGVGVFPENVIPFHMISAFVAFFFGGISPIILSFTQKSSLRYVYAILGGISLLALVLFATGNYLGLGQGGMERMIAYPILIWAILFSSNLNLAHDKRT